jgi:pimeloyl-ACP methyl ester carboxylesterase
MKTPLLILTLATALAAQAPFQVKVTGHGRPMILIPGLSASGETWDTTVEHFKDRYECHVLTVAGFAGVPRVAAPMLDRVRDGIAEYAREKKLDKPLIVGHSLGGFLALAVAEKYPALPGKLVIVDGYPFYATIFDPATTPEKAKELAAQMRHYVGDESQDDYERYVKAGIGTRRMVTAESDFQRIVAWGLASDKTAVADAMAELILTDLRDGLAAVKCPTLVLAEHMGAAERAQFAKLAGAEIENNETALHFLMWDDPKWTFGHMDRFLSEPR